MTIKHIKTGKRIHISLADIISYLVVSTVIFFSIINFGSIQ
jgi:hypothetical protein